MKGCDVLCLYPFLSGGMESWRSTQRRGLVPKENVDTSFHTWMDHLSHGNSEHMIDRLTEYYNGLWEE
jgi:hypothetical protein